MPLTPVEVRAIAELARIGISDDEVKTIQAKLNDIFELIGQMQKINTEGVEPMSHAQGAALRLRPDEVKEIDQRSLFLKLAPAPDAETGLYLVPKVIE
jgi:aspartyl-tRNA(Asn)/glutamyl-tRNA(Gln) amidotransferase subunit C